MVPCPDDIEAYLRQIVEHSPTVVWIATAEMEQILYVNHAVERELSIDREELYADPTAYLRAVHPDDQAGQLAIIEQMQEWADSGDPPQFTDEYRIEDVDGNIRWVADNTFPITDESGDIVRWAGIVTEITERKLNEAQLQRQRDSLEILNQMVRHDIRNDLQVILTYAELLTQEQGDPERNIEMLRRSAESAVDLTDSAGDLSETLLDNDGETEPIELRPLLTRLVAGIDATNDEAVVTVEDTIPEVTVEADDMLDSVFRNLLTNAIQHNDTECPEVTVRITEAPDEVTVTVADNGPGLHSVDRDDLFGRGEKGLESRGTGIGLFLVDSLVTQYGGSVTAGNGDEGGALFTVTLARA